MVENKDECSCGESADRKKKNEAESLDIILLRLLKRFFVVVIGSGLVTNALYIYGLAYYQGYIEGFGFDYAIFPLQWGDALLWTYYASIDIGANTVNFWVKISPATVIFILATVYVMSRLWMALGEESVEKEKRSIRIRYKLLCNLVKVRARIPNVFRVIYPPFRWLLMKEQSFWAFAASYIFLTFLVFVPLFVFIWIYFPLIGLHHGSSVAKYHMTRYEKNLCNGNDSSWNKCIKIKLGEKLSSEEKYVFGRIIVRDKNMVGIYTESGPVTLTMPKEFYYKGIKIKGVGDN